MKKLVYFNNFGINEELKYSEILNDTLNQKWKKLMGEVNEIEDSDLPTTSKKNSLNDLCKKNYSELKVPITDIIYEGFNKKLGAIVFNHLQNTFDLDFEDLREFNTKLKKTIQNKNIDIFSQELKDGSVNLTFEPIYSDDKTVLMETGKIAPIGSIRVSKNLTRRNLFFRIETNMFYATNPIRHELQHLTQYVNNFCIIIGDTVMKDSSFLEMKSQSDIATHKNSLFKKLLEFLELCSSSMYRWGGKIKTGWKKIGLIGQTTEEDFSKFKKELEDQGYSHDTEKNLVYYGSDVEYMPQIHDVVEDYVNRWLYKNEVSIKTLSQLYKKYGAESLDEDRLNKFTKDILGQALKDLRVIFMKKVRKEQVLKDLNRLIKKKLRDLIINTK